MGETTARAYVSGSYGLTLDGKATGFLKSVSGGAISAEVFPEKTFGDFTRKHIGGPIYEDFSIDFGFSMDPSLYKWIGESWASKFTRKNGSIVAYDYNLEAKTEREFFNALIKETVIPALDASSKDAAYLKVKFSPEYTRTKKGSGKGTALSKSNTKPFLPHSFRLEIAGLDCTKVNKIESFTVKQQVSDDAVGAERDYHKEPAGIEFPNLKISLPQISAQSWLDWFEDFVIKGNSTEDKEKSGTLTFLAPNNKDELGSIALKNMGIFRLSEDPATSNTEKIHRLTAELYCENMEFHVPAKGAAK
jgi:tail tube protein gp19